MTSRTTAHGETRAEILDEVIAWLILAGEQRTAWALRRAFDHPEPGHVCTMRDGECMYCGARE